MKEIVDFNSRNLVKSRCMDKYSIINTINKKVLGHITHYLFAIKSLGVGTMMDRERLHPHFVKMGNGRFENSGPFNSKIQYFYITEDYNPAFKRSISIS